MDVGLGRGGANVCVYLTLAPGPIAASRTGITCHRGSSFLRGAGFNLLGICRVN